MSAGVPPGQTYPDKPIRIIASELGGDNDFVARIVADGLASRFAQQVIVDNKPGGTGGVEAALSAPRDGYTLQMVGTQFWTEPLLHKTPYEPLRDFVPIIAAINSPFFLYVHPAVPANSVKELIALAEAKPGELKYASGLIGAAGHLATELFKAMAGIDLTRVEYHGGKSAVNAVVSGDVQLIFASANVGAAHIKSGALKALAAPNARPSALIPGLPSIGDAVPGYETKAVYGLLAPAGTPSQIAQLLNREIVRILNTDDMKDQFSRRGVETIAGSPEDFGSFIKSEMERWRKVLRDSGIRAE